MLIIAVSGKIGSGKSTLADFLVHNHGFLMVSFAAALRNEIEQARFPPPYIFKKPTPPWMRDLLQAWGTARRATSPHYWVHEMALTLNTAKRAGVDRLVIDDLRYRNELAMLKARGAVLVRMVNLDDEPTDSHPSETELDGYDGWDLIVSAHQGDLETIRLAAGQLAGIRRPHHTVNA